MDAFGVRHFDRYSVQNSAQHSARHSVRDFVVPFVRTHVFHSLLLQHIGHQTGEQFSIDAVDHRSVFFGNLDLAFGLRYRRAARPLRRLLWRFAVVAVIAVAAAVGGGGAFSGRQ